MTPLHWFERVDPLPVEFLTFVLAVEAILLATVVRLTQWLEMPRAINTRLGLDAPAKDAELGETIRTTQVRILSDERKRTREGGRSTFESGLALNVIGSRKRQAVGRRPASP